MARTIPFKANPRLKLALVSASILVLGGCASFTPDGGFGKTSEEVNSKLGQQVAWQRSEADVTASQVQVDSLLTKVLSVDDAVQIALLNNKGLQANYAELGISEAELVQAGRLHNPGFGFQRTEQGGSIEFERSVMFNFLGLLTMPARSEIESRRFEQAKLRAAAETVRLAYETRKAFFKAVAAQQSVKYLEQVESSAEAGTELASRMAKAGNFSQLELAREQAFHADVIAQLARTRLSAVSERERLIRLLGLKDRIERLRLPERLPDLPAEIIREEKIVSQTLDERFDLRMARQELDGLAKSLGLTRATRFVNVLEVGYLNTTSAGSPRKSGYEVSFELPIFDWGGARVARAESLYTQAMQRVAEMAVHAHSSARESYAGYLATFKLASHYRDEIVPLRKKISDENMLRYNGMLIGVFELLADAREQVGSVNAYLDAMRDFWLAETSLKMAMDGVGGNSPATDK
ncbi:MAG: TolC family protein [Sulfuricella denitrificans]|nr:TolC family protein [Sulfuricella denitrificans]